MEEEEGLVLAEWRRFSRRWMQINADEKNKPETISQSVKYVDLKTKFVSLKLLFLKICLYPGNLILGIDRGQLQKQGCCPWFYRKTGEQ